MEMTDRELLELIAAKVGGLETDVKELKKITTKTDLTIENEIKPKIQTLFAGYFQNSDKLCRIENEVSRRKSSWL